jgi:hypothetical protein
MGIQAVLLYQFSSNVPPDPVYESEEQYALQSNDDVTSHLSSGVSSTALSSRLSKYNLSLSTHQKRIAVPDDQRVISFLHIGKTGGSTISVNIRNGCHEYYMEPCKERQHDGWILNETVASQRIQSYYHMEQIPHDKIEKITTIVTVVRNPINRFISAFAYAHPLNFQATSLSHSRETMEQFSCFPKLTYLVKAAMGKAEISWNKAHINALREKERQANTVQFGKMYSRPKPIQEVVPPMNCTELAMLAFGMNKTLEVETTPPFVNHMTFDYRQYYRSMPADKEILVLRHEALWEDWRLVNDLLSKDNTKYNDWPNVPPFHRVERNVSHFYAMKDRYKLHSLQEKNWLCNLLQDEIRTYLMILMRAVNLSEEDLIEAMDDVDKSCSEV